MNLILYFFLPLKYATVYVRRGLGPNCKSTRITIFSYGQNCPSTFISLCVTDCGPHSHLLPFLSSSPRWPRWSSTGSSLPSGTHWCSTRGRTPRSTSPRPPAVLRARRARVPRGRAVDCHGTTQGRVPPLPRPWGAAARH